MADEFKTHQPGLTAPAEAAEVIVPSDGQALAHATRALYVGASGDLRVTFVGGDTVTLTGVAGGSILPLRVTHVRATGTTAGAILGLR